MAELESTLSYNEWREWIAFYGLYDLPDGFNVSARLGPPLAGIGGVKADAEAFAPIMQPPPGAPVHRPHNLAGAIAFLKANPDVIRPK